MKAPSEVEAEIDRLVGELDKIDKALDGGLHEQSTGEVIPAALDVLAEAEDAWIEHRDAKIEELANGSYEGRQLPGEDKLNALTRATSADARRAWDTFRHAQRLTKRLRERADRVQHQLSGRQTQVKIINAEAGAPSQGGQVYAGPGRGEPMYGRRAA